MEPEILSLYITESESKKILFIHQYSNKLKLDFNLQILNITKDISSVEFKIFFNHNDEPLLTFEQPLVIPEGENIIAASLESFISFDEQELKNRKISGNGVLEVMATISDDQSMSSKIYLQGENQ